MPNARTEHNSFDQQLMVIGDQIDRYLNQDRESLEAPKMNAWRITQEPEATEEQQAEAIHYIAKCHWIRACHPDHAVVRMPFSEYLTTWNEDSHGDRKVTRPNGTTTTFSDLLSRYYSPFMENPRRRLKKGLSEVFEKA